MPTSSEVGLGNVQNYSPASLQQAIDPTVSNAYMTPQTTFAMITNLLSAATADSSGTVTLNVGINPADGSNRTAALTAAGLANIIGDNTVNPSLVQLELLSLFSRSNVSVVSVTGNNAISASVSPSTPTNKLYGLIRFVAAQNNTGPVTFTSGGPAMDVVHWDGTPILPGQIKAADSYSLLPINNTLVLVDPTVPTSTTPITYADSIMGQHTTVPNPHPMYATPTQITDAVASSFKGAYVGAAALTGTQYTASLPGAGTPNGMFTVKFNDANPMGASLTVNDVSKTLKLADGATLPANEIKAGEMRQITATPDAFILSSVTSDSTAIANTAIATHESSSDPHSQYWNTDRGLAAILTAITTHLNATDPHNQYWNDARGGIVITSKITDHENATDPHPQYTTTSRATSVTNSRIITHTQAIDPHGDRAYSDLTLSSHIADIDPHAQYTTNARAQTIVNNSMLAALSNVAPNTIGSTNLPGISVTNSRSDHTHAHGDQLGGTLHSTATTTSDGFMAAADKSKLITIAVGAQVNSVTSVAGKTGDIVVTKTDVGLSNVDNTSDVSKVVLSASKLTTARNISISGAVVGSTIFDGSNNIDISVTIPSIGNVNTNFLATFNANKV